MHGPANIGPPVIAWKEVMLSDSECMISGKISSRFHDWQFNMSKTELHRDYQISSQENVLNLWFMGKKKKKKHRHDSIETNPFMHLTPFNQHWSDMGINLLDFIIISFDDV